MSNAKGSANDHLKSIDGRIVFSSDRAGTIFILDSGKLNKIVKGGGGRPRFTRQADKVYYGATGMVYVYDIERGISKSLEFMRKYRPVGFDISPDGKRLLILSYGNHTERNDPANIFTMNVDGSDVKQVTFFEGRGFGYTTGGPEHPRWSPDGQLIAFESPDMGKKGEFDDTLYIMKSDGTDIKKVIGSEAMGGLAEFNWAPDGKSIVFTGLKTQRGADGTPAPPLQIFEINIDGSNLRQITNGKYPCQYPDFSPNGKQIVYSSRRHPIQNNMGFGISGAELFVINVDGADEHRITPAQVVGRWGLGIFPWDKVYATDKHPDLA